MRDSVEDLSALVRRGELDSADRRRLEIALASSSEARLLHQAGLELDQAGSVLPGDDALAERVKQRVLRRALPVVPARAKRRRLLPWGIAAAVACVAVAAGGTVAGFHPLRAVFSTLAAVGPKAPAKATALALRPTPPATGAGSLPVQPEASVSAARAPVAAVVPKVVAAVEGPSASELFANAASARRRGKPQEAMLLYDALQNRFPGSAQANAADMALGMLRLQRGQARSALDHFTHYLSRNPRSELAPEALWGKAQALSSLGRGAEARRNFASLLERYPDSTYAAAARAKLEAPKSEP
jgi:TolA-binding protein